MKNLLRKCTGILSLLTFLLILPIHYAHSKNVDELFGFKSFDNATNYFSSEFIENNKFKYNETISGFWYLNISDKVSSPYFDIFYIFIDNNNIIHSVQGEKVYPSIDRCLTFLEKLVSMIETRKQIEFTYQEIDLGTILLKRYISQENNTSVNVQCNEFFDPIKYVMTHYIRSTDFLNAITEYYNQD